VACPGCCLQNTRAYKYSFIGATTFGWWGFFFHELRCEALALGRAVFLTSSHFILSVRTTPRAGFYHHVTVNLRHD
jgi:hypothetical protein